MLVLTTSYSGYDMGHSVSGLKDLKNKDSYNGITNVGLWSSRPESYACVPARTEPTKITTHIGVLYYITPTPSVDESRK